MDFYVGIDVSKFKHTVAIIDEEGEIRKKSFDISNSREGYKCQDKIPILLHLIFLNLFLFKFILKPV